MTTSAALKQLKMRHFRYVIKNGAEYKITVHPARTKLATQRDMKGHDENM